MERKKERIAEAELHKTVSRRVDIDKIDWFQTSKCYKAVKLFEETGVLRTVLESPPRPSTASEDIRKILCQVRRNPERSMHKWFHKLWFS
ncbi:hypothetical protein KIN20_003087 [Parelaphostrongylus tenuis]|uniref:Uncharacterized protein n=1 Tax=Parelaphostrongylus tenuis TaxID=148309 RepID=A0AAD5QE05_PARTN|nr:hypothetical protein KIN20_003087 [Parelaphostrongylus tenuis]